jgi:MFS superfamily sulfate permease-like transporter
VPVAVVKGIQVGAGLSLVISAGTSLVKPLGWVQPFWDNRLWASGAFAFLLVATLIPRLPYALVVFIMGLVIAATTRLEEHSTASRWHPHFSIPAGHSLRTGILDAAIPQLPLTTLNSVLAVTSLAESLFPTYPPTPSTTSIGFSVAIVNLVGCWFNAMPMCHGSGGLAGQYRFGARSGSSIIILGLIKLFLGLFVGNGIVPLLQHFPKALLGIMVIAAGVELSRVGQSVGEARDLWEQVGEESEENVTYTKKSLQVTAEESKDRWMVMLVTVAGCLAFKNDAVGFAAGLVWHWGLKVPAMVHRGRRSRGRIMLGVEDDAMTASGKVSPRVT